MPGEHFPTHGSIAPLPKPAWQSLFEPRILTAFRAKNMRVLIIEDDAETADYVSDGLRRSGHVADQVSDGREGLMIAAGGEYDVIVVDRMLPGVDGLAIVKTIRSAGIKSAVLFLTARGGIDDRVEGLEAGGDDYLTKPFAFSELLARTQCFGTQAAAGTN